MNGSHNEHPLLRLQVPLPHHEFIPLKDLERSERSGVGIPVNPLICVIRGSNLRNPRFRYFQLSIILKIER